MFGDYSTIQIQKINSTLVLLDLNHGLKYISKTIIIREDHLEVYFSNLSWAMYDLICLSIFWNYFTGGLPPYYATTAMKILQLSSFCQSLIEVHHSST